MSKIAIRNLELFGYHGVYPEEQEKGQRFWVDVELEGDFAAQDELGETVDYSQVVKKIRQVNRAKRFQLIESFAKAIAEELLREFPRACKVRARVRKKPTDLVVAWVAAEVSKERSL